MLSAPAASTSPPSSRMPRQWSSAAPAPTFSASRRVERLDLRREAPLEENRRWHSKNSESFLVCLHVIGSFASFRFYLSGWGARVLCSCFYFPFTVSWDSMRKMEWRDERQNRMVGRAFFDLCISGDTRTRSQSIAECVGSTYSRPSCRALSGLTLASGLVPLRAASTNASTSISQSPRNGEE